METVHPRRSKPLWETFCLFKVCIKALLWRWVVGINQNSNTGRYESFYSRQKRELSILITAKLLWETFCLFQQGMYHSAFVVRWKQKWRAVYPHRIKPLWETLVNQPELTAVAVLPYICKGSLNQSREFCRRTLAFHPSSDLLDLWTTSFQSQGPPYLCCWIVELYIYRIPCKDYGKSCVWQTLRTNNTGSLDQGTSTISCDGQHCIQCSGWALLVTIPPCDLRRHDCSTNIAIGFSAESWNLGSSTSPCSHESWERISTRTILSASRTTPLLAPPMMQRPVDHIYQWWHLSKLVPVNDICQIWTLYK